MKTFTQMFLYKHEQFNAFYPSLIREGLSVSWPLWKPDSVLEVERTLKKTSNTSNGSGQAI